MKKILFGACIALSVFFAGCSDFLDGSDLKSQIDKQISFANAKNRNVYVDVVNDQCGVLLQSRENEIKVGVPFSIDFTANKDYCFYKWAAFEKKSLESIINNNSASFFYTEGKYDNLLLDEKFVSFENPYQISTKATVYSENTEIVIVPLCVKRQRVTGFSNDYETVLYQKDSTFYLTFDQDVSEEMFIKGTFLMGSIINSDNYFWDEAVIANPKYIKIYAKTTKNSSEAIDITKNFIVYIVGNKVYFKPFQKVYPNAMLGYSAFIESSAGVLLKDINDTFYSSSKDLPEGVYSLFCDTRDFETRNIEIRIYKGFFGSSFEDSQKDSEYTGSYEDCVFNFTQTKEEDVEPPRFLDVQFYLMDSDLIYRTGINCGTPNFPYVFVKDDVYNDTNNVDDDTKNIDTVLNQCRRNFAGDAGFLPLRVKNKLAFAVRAVDSMNADSFSVSDGAVERVYYKFYRLTDSSGNTKTDYDESLNYTYIDLITGGVAKETFIESAKDRPAELTGEKIETFRSNNTDSLIADFYFGNNTVDEFEDGLYVLELYGRDSHGNEGTKIPPETGFSSSDSNKKYYRYNSQMWFVKDTAPPETKAEDFTFIEPGKWYNSSDAFEGFGFKYDGAYSSQWSADRKIVDSGDKRYSSLFTYRICKVMTSAEAAEWDAWSDEKKLADYGWYATAHTSVEGDENYIFDKIYGEGKWLPENLKNHPEDYAIYAYVRDDVGNISKQIKIDINIDNTAPKVLDKGITRDSDGQYFYIQMEDTEAGVKKIYYSVTDNNGTDYDTILIPAKGNTGIWVSGDNKYMTQDVDYTVDTEKHEIIFNNPITNDSNVYFIYPENLENAFGGTIKFTLEDAAGNKSEEQIVEW